MSNKETILKVLNEHLKYNEGLGYSVIEPESFDAIAEKIADGWVKVEELQKQVDALLQNQQSMSETNQILIKKAVDNYYLGAHTVLRAISVGYGAIANQDKMDLRSDKEFMQAIADTIESFPIPSLADGEDYFAAMKREGDFYCAGLQAIENIIPDEYKNLKEGDQDKPLHILTEIWFNVEDALYK